MNGSALIEIPSEFAAQTIAREGAQGRAWIHDLPSIVADLCRHWALRIDGELLHGYLAVVIPVRRGSERCALKVSWVDEENEFESLALSTWNGNGAVRLLGQDAERGALLLEWLNPRVTLDSVPIDDAVSVAATLLGRLSVRSPAGIRTTGSVARRWYIDFPERCERFDPSLPQRIVHAAREACESLAASPAELLVNGDLHYGNVLRGAREPWLVIDPKPLSGDAEFAVAPLLWTRFAAGVSIERRFRSIVESAGLDETRARSWTLARALDNRLWSLSMGFIDDAERCTAIINWLTREPPA